MLNFGQNLHLRIRPLLEKQLINEQISHVERLFHKLKTCSVYFFKNNNNIFCECTDISRILANIFINKL